MIHERPPICPRLSRHRRRREACSPKLRRSGAGRRGAVLILSLAVLVMLAMLATVFATIAGVEQSVSRNYVDGVRARLVAESGVHAAISALRTYLDGGGNFAGAAKADKVWLYRGEDADLNNAISAGEWDVDWPPVFPANGKVDTASVPLEVVPNPSFAVEASPTSPAFPPLLKRMTIEGYRVGVSGTLEAGTYGMNADTYTLRVMSANSMIYVNDTNPNLPRILNYLCDELGVPWYGDAIYGNPATGARNYYGSINDLKKVIPVAAHFDRLAPFLTTESWVDDAVANPVPLSVLELPKYTAALRGWFYRRPVDGAGSPIYRAGHGWAYTRSLSYVNRNAVPLRFCLNATDQNQRRLGGVYGWDELNPQWIEVSSRAPIDLNSAPRAILIAILRGLKGFFAMETATSIPHYGYDFYHRLAFDPSRAYDCLSDNCFSMNDWPRWHVDELATLYETMEVRPPGAGSPTTGPDAGRLADAILARRPFRSWEDFHGFCDSLVGSGNLIWDNRAIWRNPVTGQSSQSRQLQASQAMADVLKANFNPNLHLNELNPNAPLLWQVDKTDLIVASTEGTLRPMGVFRIDSLGRILQPDTERGDAFASATPAGNDVVAEARVYATVKVFDVHRATTQKDFFGDPGPPANRGTFEPRNGGYPYRTNYGLSVESGPEPHNGPAAQDNEWEGYVQLATNGGDSLNPVPNNGTVVAGRWNQDAADTLGARAHGHFMYDFDLHHSSVSAGPSYVENRILTSMRPLPLGYRSRALAYNFRDPSEPANAGFNPDTTTAYTSPYCSRYNAGRHRQARSFRVDKNNAIVDAAGNPLATFRYAPSDHRVDGAYAERHASLVYSPQNYHWRRGTVEYWIKPGFNVTNAGKIRTFFNLSRIRNQNNGGHPSIFNPSPFIHSFLPHQVYDLQRNTDDPPPLRMAQQDGLPFNYIKEYYWWGTPPWWWGPWHPKNPDWPSSELTRAQTAVYDPDLRRLVDRMAMPATMVGFKPRSFAFGYAQVYGNSNVQAGLPSGWPATSPQIVRDLGASELRGQEIAINTYPLSHAGHPSYGWPYSHPNRSFDPFNPARGDVMDQGRWTHVVLSWHMSGNTDISPWWDNADHFRQILQIRVNGRLFHNMSLDMSYWNPVLYNWPGGISPGRSSWQTYLPMGRALWMQDEYDNLNPIRFGSPSLLDTRHHPFGNDRNTEDCNFPADSTIDELYLWSDRPVKPPSVPSLMRPTLTDPSPGASLTNFAWERFKIGRYYKGALPQFTSKMIDLTADQNQRVLAPPSGSAAAAPVTPTYRLYGLYWTAYNDNIYNYNRSPGVAASPVAGSPPPSGPLNVGLTFRVSVDGASNFGGTSYSNEQYSPVLVADPNRDITDPKRLQYQFEFTGTSNINYTLLETPILDDVWIVYGPQQAEIKEWVVQ